MKIKIYCNITYITSHLAIHNKPCMHMDGYFKPNPNPQIKCLNAHRHRHMHMHRHMHRQ